MVDDEPHGPAQEPGERAADLAALAALEDPTRRALYELVSSGTEPTSRDAAAAALGLSRSTAAFHLDRLAREGLLAVEFRRLGERTGPGSGRPAKLYRRAPGEVSVSVPDRRYELAGELLALAVEEAGEAAAPVRAALRRVAKETGRADAAGAGSLDDALAAAGYEPRADAGGGTVMGNCPFHRLARRHTALVCELNRELVEGVAEGAGAACTVRTDPGAGGCCVRVLPAG
ncbi:helix-turn-helix transcriptional regulator [Georgenia thermotolerans]|uniref:Helix-turn-helix domain-containing protein n=1 Tax=Georgenia thermotolerans TaxID=527326 RepID=A0A7J5UKZ5_9MICO|nr:helix-turn-helix domain-containing protein [Georgenia thermotolerans]KAE8763058.1 helix-turn-helix domain-containing protein [Georgenia thermotolerans]